MNSHTNYMQAHFDEFAKIRHDIHQHPELGFKEHRTSHIVQQLLKEWGYEVHTGYGTTGVVGVLKKGNSNKTMGIRADMDALPLQETTGLPYASVHDNIMHACGHDGHTTMLLAAAKYLAEKGEFSGTLNLIFQPAEESLGGARKMMDDGLFKDHPCDAIFGMHNAPGFPQGQLLFRDGPAMSSSDYVTITITGVGGHGAHPHLAKDPIVAAASIIMALQTIVSREVNPSQLAVITIGAMNAGHINNVIPQQAVLELSVRALNAEVRSLLENRIKALVNAQAESFGVRADIHYERGYPVLVNTQTETDFARQTAIEFAGQDNVVLQTPARLGSEDFAFMLEKVPGCYLFIGNGEGNKEGACAVHNPNYNFNDKNLVNGGAFWAYLAERYLSHAG
ncbi:M20 aminoacylase family protein [Advenella alkanexedens]|uniref:M20 aminoacylase family protein n=1 Tax=Advenella alkanexedens TaxID=1481665 RepID=UPI00267581A2|nr:M20 aminoacylase family protein [Advenella alkanexedens]WKU18627.1 M20 aminoacylase family protein [Advenella alkanexedens]